MLCHSDLWQWSRHPKKVTQAHGGQRFNPSANLKLGRILETREAMEEKERRGFKASNAPITELMDNIGT